MAKRPDFFLEFLPSKKSSEKSSRLARALHRSKKMTAEVKAERAPLELGETHPPPKKIFEIDIKIKSIKPSQQIEDAEN